MRLGTVGVLLVICTACGGKTDGGTGSEFAGGSGEFYVQGDVPPVA